MWALSLWFSFFLSFLLSIFLSFFMGPAGDGGPYSDEVRHLLGILRPGKIGAGEGEKRREVRSIEHDTP